MADTLVERVTGQSGAAAVPVEVHLVMSSASLLEADAAPAQLQGYGPVPGPLARSWIRDPDAEVWLRRLFTGPATGRLVAMESERRCFTGLLRRFVMLRDQVCRTPWCDAPARHVDHPVPVAAGARRPRPTPRLSVRPATTPRRRPAGTPGR